jgi:hypothetical protein
MRIDVHSHLIFLDYLSTWQDARHCQVSWKAGPIS